VIIPRIQKAKLFHDVVVLRFFLPQLQKCCCYW